MKQRDDKNAVESVRSTPYHLPPLIERRLTMIKRILTKKQGNKQNLPMATRQYGWRDILRHQEKRRALCKNR